MKRAAQPFDMEMYSLEGGELKDELSQKVQQDDQEKTLAKKFAEWPDVFVPRRFRTRPDPHFDWQEPGTYVVFEKDILIYKVFEIAFDFTSQETQICNDVGNLDLLWVGKKAERQSVAYDMVFGVGGRLGQQAEFIYTVVRYLFCKCGDDYEDYEKEEGTRRLIDAYRKRMRSKFATPELWLQSVFLAGPSQNKFLISNICDDFGLAKKWTRTPK